MCLVLTWIAQQLDSDSSLTGHLMPPRLSKGTVSLREVDDLCRPSNGTATFVSSCDSQGPSSIKLMTPQYVWSILSIPSPNTQCHLLLPTEAQGGGM